MRSSSTKPPIRYQAAEKDTEGKHMTEIGQQMRKVAEADSSSRQGETDEQTYARAMRDPEVQQIMSDPVMVSILQQAQNDPPSMMQHMQNPDIRKKVETLIRAVSARFRENSGERIVALKLLIPICDMIGYHQDWTSLSRRGESRLVSVRAADIVLRLFAERDKI